MHLARSFHYPFFILFFHFPQIFYTFVEVAVVVVVPTDDGDLSGIGQIYLEIGHCRPAVCPNFFTLSFWRSIHTFLIDMCLCVFINPENISKERRRRKKRWQFLLLFFFVLHKIENTAYPSFFYFALSLCPIHPSNPRELDHIVECFLILRLLLLLQQPSPSQVYVYFSYLMISKECSQSGDCYSMTLQQE